MWVDNLSALDMDTNTSTSTYQWLTHTGLLSKALKRCCKELSVQVYNQLIAAATPDELHLLQLEAEAKCFIRQVYLCGDGVPWLFARTVAPMTTYLKYKDKFDYLGTKLLGESLLSSINSISRGAFSFTTTIADWQKCCTPSHSVRRSLFKLDGYDLLLTEAFLQKIPNYPFDEVM